MDEHQAPPALARFMNRIQARLEKRIQFFSTISTQRIGGFLTTFFTETNQTNSNEQNLPFMYLFPYTIEAVKKNLHEFKVNHPHHKASHEQIKIKRRFIYF